MGESKFIDRLGIIIAVCTLIFAWILFYSNTSEMIGSFTAAAMTSGLVWSTYIILKWLILANRQ